MFHIQTSDVMDIAQKACAYARNCIKRSETEEGLNALDRLGISNEVVNMRNKVDELLGQICSQLNIKDESIHSAIQIEIYSKVVAQKEVGNCFEYAILAFDYIRKNPHKSLDHIEIEVVGIGPEQAPPCHVVLSLGKKEDRIICDPLRNRVFRLNNAPSELKTAHFSRGKYYYKDYNPKSDHITPLFSKKMTPLLSEALLQKITLFLTSETQGPRPL